MHAVVVSALPGRLSDLVEHAFVVSVGWRVASGFSHANSRVRAVVDQVMLGGKTDGTRLLRGCACGRRRLQASSLRSRKLGFHCRRSVIDNAKHAISGARRARLKAQPAIHARAGRRGIAQLERNVTGVENEAKQNARLTCCCELD